MRLFIDSHGKFLCSWLNYPRLRKNLRPFWHHLRMFSLFSLFELFSSKLLVDAIWRRLHHWIGLESTGIWNATAVLSTQPFSILGETAQLLLVSQNQQGEECLDLQAQSLSPRSSGGSLPGSQENMPWCWRTKAAILPTICSEIEQKVPGRCFGGQ